jgi:hypothetical protein
MTSCYIFCWILIQILYKIAVPVFPVPQHCKHHRQQHPYLSVLRLKLHEKPQAGGGGAPPAASAERRGRVVREGRIRGWGGRDKIRE